MIIHDDCINVLKQWKKEGKCEFIDLVYIDPPFGRNSVDKQFGIDWNKKSINQEILNKLYGSCIIEIMKYESKAYISEIYESVTLIREMLKPTGSFYYHCDPTMSHYIKIMLDYIFGGENFRNEIVWYYKTGGISKNSFAQKHDILLYYTKTENYIFNSQREPKTHDAMLKAIEKGNEIFEDEGGQYTWYLRPGHNPKYPDGVKVYTEAYVRDIWDIPAIAPVAKERLGYPTQKPEALLERIIKASSNPNDLVVDFYNGGGTTVAVAAKNNRRYIGVTIDKLGYDLTIKRLGEII